MFLFQNLNQEVVKAIAFISPVTVNHKAHVIGSVKLSIKSCNVDIPSFLSCVAGPVLAIGSEHHCELHRVRLRCTDTIVCVCATVGIAWGIGAIVVSIPHDKDISILAITYTHSWIMVCTPNRCLKSNRNSNCCLRVDFP